MTEPKREDYITEVDLGLCSGCAFFDDGCPSWAEEEECANAEGESIIYIKKPKVELVTYEELSRRGDTDSCITCPVGCSQSKAYKLGLESADCSGGHFRLIPEVEKPDVIRVPYWSAEAEGNCKRCPYGSFMNGGKNRCGDAPIDCTGGYLRPANESPKEEEECDVTLVDDTEELGQESPPDRYNWRGTESLPFCIENNLNTIQNNVVKYIYRYPKKGGLDALKKCVVYLEKAIQFNQKSHEVHPDIITEFITNNNFSWREGTVIMTVCLGSYALALARVKDLIKEVYGEEVER